MIPGSGRPPGEGNGNPLQYSCLGNPLNRGAWVVTIHGSRKESDMTWQLNNNKPNCEHLQTTFLKVLSSLRGYVLKNHSILIILKYSFYLEGQIKCINFSLKYGASLVAQPVKNLPAMQETWVLFLGKEDPLEQGMATHSSILAWRIPGTEEPGGLQSMGSQRVGQD